MPRRTAEVTAKVTAEVSYGSRTAIECSDWVTRLAVCKLKMKISYEKCMKFDNALTNPVKNLIGIISALSNTNKFAERVLALLMSGFFLINLRIINQKED